MRILIFHGYLLRGTGSNIYNASLVRALTELGHEVHLLCQDRGAEELPFVDAVGRWEGGRLRVETVREPVRCTAYLPDIGRVLPVYVDRETGEEYEIVGKVLPMTPSPSLLPYAVENLRLCGCSLEQLVQRDLNDCPHCGRRLPAMEG